MRFTTRVFLCTAVPAAFFVAALGIGLWALQRTQAEFEHYIARDQALAASLTEMYAQGLQMGQAVRNVVIDRSAPSPTCRAARCASRARPS